MQIPILSGVYADNAGDFRTSYPRNLVPVPKEQGISAGYLRPAEGVAQWTDGQVYDPADALFNAEPTSGWPDASGTYALTATGTVVRDTAVQKFGDASYRFAAYNEFISHPTTGEGAIPTPGDTEDFTFDCWYRIQTNSPTQTHLIAGWVDGSGFIGFAFRMNAASTHVAVQYGATEIDIELLANLPVDQFMHLAAARRGGVLYLFVDGVLKVSHAVDALPFSLYGDIFAIGPHFAGGSVSNPYWVDDLRILTGEALWVADFVPPLSGLVVPVAGGSTPGVGPGPSRGGINWKGQCYRVMGTKLVRINADGTHVELGDVGSGGQCSFAYSFDRLAVASGGRLYYWNGVTLTHVTDPDLGQVLDVLYVDGYFMTTDGEYLVVTELNDPTAVDPLKYGSAELDADPVVRVLKVRNEAHAVGRYTIEVYTNLGGAGFPFQRNDGAQIHRGAVGTHAAIVFDADKLAFLGGGLNEPCAVWFGGGGTSEKISTREIDTLLQAYTEAQLSAAVLEARIDKSHKLLLVHLPDQTLVFDAAASGETGERVWFTLDSGRGARSTYRARDLVWCFDKWLVADPLSGAHGYLSERIGTHYGAKVSWEFGTQIVYNEGRGAIFHELELVGLPGGAALGADPVVWTQYSLDGRNWSKLVPAYAGKQGETLRRIVWRRQGRMDHYRMQRFVGTSDVRTPFARLEALVEGLR